jgi:hypothetical protein
MDLNTHTMLEVTGKCSKEFVDSKNGNMLQTLRIDSTRAAEADYNNLLRMDSTSHDIPYIENQRELSPAEKVFGIAELAEKILLEMKLLDIISANNICHSISAAIWGSSDIRRLLFLESRNRKALRLPLDFVATGKFSKGLRMLYMHGTSDNPKMIHLKVRVGAREGHLPVLGPLLRSVLISDPPIQRAEIRPACCMHLFDDVGVVRKAKSDYPGPTEVIVESGITFGNLLLAAEQAQHSHRHCAHAMPLHHDKAGNVVPRIEFRAHFKAPAEDSAIGDLGEHPSGRRFYEERFHAL